jgi:chloride channel protein, CIC family
MVETTIESPSRWVTLWRASVGGLLGGLAGATAAGLVTQVIKETLAVVSRQDTWMLLVLPLLGLTLSVLVLRGVGREEAGQRPPRPPEDEPPRRVPPRLPSRFFTFPQGPRADLTADVVATAGEEERFPFWLVPLRVVAIVATVGLGAPMGTESPAAHLGVAAGSWLGNRPRLRQIVRPAAVAGGAAAVAALMGVGLVGTAFMLELGRRRKIPLSLERVVAALVGGGVGWALDLVFNLDFIRLIVPKVPPHDLFQAVKAALFIGGIAGAVTSLTGEAIYWARGLRATPVRLVAGGLTVLACAAAVAVIASPAAAIGPGGAAIVWAETTETAALTLLAVGLLRAAMTTAAVAAGGCGGIFVPFLAIGDIVGRVFAELFGVPPDLAGASGAAAGITGGYRLPWTAVMMVLGVGGPFTSKLTCLAVVGVATIASVGCSRGLTMLKRIVREATARSPRRSDTAPHPS